LEIRIARINVKGEGYFVLYPLPPRGGGHAWIVLDADGVPVCFPALRQKRGEEFVDDLEAAAKAAAKSGAGEPLPWRPPGSAILWTVDLGRAAICGPEQDISPETPVWFPAGLPAALIEEFGWGVGYLQIRLSAFVDRGLAVPLPPGVVPPPRGAVITAAGFGAAGG